MMNNFSAWFAAATLREKILVLFAILLAAAIFIFYAIYRPLMGAITNQQNAYRDAILRRAHIEMQVQAAQGKNNIDKNNGEKKSPAQLNQNQLKELIDISAGQAGFTFDRAEIRGNGDIDIAISSVAPSAIMKWLNEIGEKGAILQQVDIKSADNGNVSFMATLRGSAS
ncbi:hypothetical protein LPB140_03165 [Sphingorhabdus lutea]|uniref:Type II secretion system protein M n=1 Tax=Sphingorhabdus lutea TaxID=1913578 RepID=A0A1L3JA31_9SPHN|nr:type II secretion system protein GspM [Sphingorhabdus lutea]APG61984.1 hypothetical protein LPB140_03165 [Sphingorhabdus lutea]